MLPGSAHGSRQASCALVPTPPGPLQHSCLGNKALPWKFQEEFPGEMHLEFPMGFPVGVPVGIHCGNCHGKSHGNLHLEFQWELLFPQTVFTLRGSNGVAFRRVLWFLGGPGRVCRGRSNHVNYHTKSMSPSPLCSEMVV